MYRRPERAAEERQEGGSEVVCGSLPQHQQGKQAEALLTLAMYFDKRGRAEKKQWEGSRLALATEIWRFFCHLIGAGLKDIKARKRVGCDGQRFISLLGNALPTPTRILSSYLGEVWMIL